MARSITDVIRELDEIVAWSVEHRSRIGYFAALYRRVTIRVRDGIQAGEFADGPRMERLDVVFASRYLDALQKWRTSDTTVCPCWHQAFTVAQEYWPLVLQQLLVGMNVHINLDLGIAAAEITTPETIADLAGDFQRINQILAEEQPKVRAQMEAIFPLLRFLDRIGGGAENVVLNFSMEIARREAWEFALSLSQGDVESKIAERRTFVSGLSTLVAHQPMPLRLGLMVIRICEPRDPRRVLAILAS
ncbi:MAG: DUF5995 family protein [Fimbriimonas sp.]